MTPGPHLQPEAVPHGWIVERHGGSAAEVHGRPMPEPVTPSLWVLAIDRPAFVLGSAEPVDHVDADALDAAGVELVRRRSGGGGVLLVPGEFTWIDLLIPSGHPRWVDDVGRATHWVGEVWVAALATLGVDGRVHRGPMERRRWSERVCFAGLGPGEVVDGAGRKLVGLSQRRTRAGARFQTAVHHRWDVGAHAALLALDDAERAALVGELRGAVATVEASSEHLVAAFVGALVGSLPVRPS